MAREDFEHQDDRGHSSDWRDDDWRQHRWIGRGREFPERDRHSGAGGQDWRREEHGQSSGPLPRGYRDRSEWREGYRPYAEDRAHHGSEWGRRGQGSDWDAEYSRPVDWHPRHSQGREPWTMRGPEDWERSRPERFSGARYEEDWSRSGPFVGRGPRGYRRSDDRIHEEVCEALTRHGRIDASGMDVSVSSGVVTLRGTVDARHTKRMAEDLVDEIAGVRDVHNELRVQDREAHQEESYGHYAASDHAERGHTTAAETASSGEGRFHSSSGSEHRDNLREGMEVMGSDGENVGDVKEVSNNSFLVDRPMKRKVYVPFAAIRSMSGHRVTLNVRADEVDVRGWASPELMKSSTSESH